MMKDNDFWYDLFVSFMNFIKEEEYPLNDLGLNIISFVDYVNSTDDGTYINENVSGFYFVREDNSIYNANRVLQHPCVTGDYFTYSEEQIPYFIASDNNEHEYSLKGQWNNTKLGDNGISVGIGGLDSDDTEAEEQFKTWNVPQIQLQLGAMVGVDPTERKNVVAEKSFAFAIFIAVKEKDLYENISGYDETYRVKKIMSALMYEYFNNKQCAQDMPGTSRMKWTYDFVTVFEERPLAVTAIEINLMFK